MARKKKPDNGKPELDDGYIRIANELWQALIDYDFTVAQMKIIAVIIRETYGYNRKSKNLSVSYLAQAAHLSEIGARKALKNLLRQNVVEVYEEHTSRQSREIGINKYYLDWIRAIRQDTSEGNRRRAIRQDTSEGNWSTPLEGNGSIPKPIQYKDTFKDNKPTASERGLEDDFSDIEREMFGD